MSSSKTVYNTLRSSCNQLKLVILQQLVVARVGIWVRLALFDNLGVIG